MSVCRGDKMKPFCYVTNIWQVLSFLARGPWRVWRRMVLQKLLKITIRKLHYLYSWHITGNVRECPATIQATIMVPVFRAPAHFALDVREYLNKVFTNRWIGRDGPLQWQPGSPDLTPMDFFIWGRWSVWCTRHRQTLQKSWLPVWQKLQQLFVRQSFARRYQLRINVNGRHFQQLL